MGPSDRARLAVVTLGLFLGLALSAPAAAQPMARPGLAPDPIDQSRALSTRTVPALPAPAPPAERLVPERRVRVPGTDRQIVVPSHYERRISDQQSQVPPLSGYGAGGEIIHIPAGERRPAELRQSP